VQFGLKDLGELPSLKEFDEIRRMAIADEPGPEPLLATVAAEAVVELPPMELPPMELPSESASDAALPEPPAEVEIESTEPAAEDPSTNGA
jgi:hypothetical protein